MLVYTIGKYWRTLFVFYVGDEITTCYLRTGAGGAKEDGADDDDDEEEEDESKVEGGNSPASPSGRRRSSSNAAGGDKENATTTEGGDGGKTVTSSSGSTIVAGASSPISKLKPMHYRALENLKSIEQHVNNTICQFASQPIINAQMNNNNNNATTGGTGNLNNTSGSQANVMLSPHQQAVHQQSMMTDKERHDLIISRIGQVSSVTATRSIEQKIPRVDIPEGKKFVLFCFFCTFVKYFFLQNFGKCTHSFVLNLSHLLEHRQIWK